MAGDILPEGLMVLPQLALALETPLVEALVDMQLGGLAKRPRRALWMSLVNMPTAKRACMGAGKGRSVN